jgi:AmmeMemoRadiSam system protein A
LRAIGIVGEPIPVAGGLPLADQPGGAGWEGAILMAGVPAMDEAAVVVEPAEAGQAGTVLGMESMARRVARWTGFPRFRWEELRQRWGDSFLEGPAGPEVAPACGVPGWNAVEDWVRRSGVNTWVWVLVGGEDARSLARRLAMTLFPELLWVVCLRNGGGAATGPDGDDRVRYKLDALAGWDRQAMEAAGVGAQLEWWILAEVGAGLHWEGCFWSGLQGKGLPFLHGAVPPGRAVLGLDPPVGRMLVGHERSVALQLARLTVETVTRTGRVPTVNSGSLPLALLAPRACFVTLTRRGQLRGCIGHLTAQMPLYQAVMENARNAALYDYRFEPVAPAEVEELTIEISVLTRPRPVEAASPEELLDRLEPGRDGVILHLGARTATFLPQVWEKLPDRRQFMAQLCMKAGCLPDAWRSRDARVELYRVEAFSEREA